MTRSRIRFTLSMCSLGVSAGAGWHPEIPTGGAAGIDHATDIARIAERGLFAMVFPASRVTLLQRHETTAALCRCWKAVCLQLPHSPIA